MLKFNEANPLNIFGLRQLSHCPPHFEKVQFDISTTEKTITDWVYENLSGRFYFGHVDVTDIANGKNSTVRRCLVAFEEASEASYFAIFLPSINVFSY